MMNKRQQGSVIILILAAIAAISVLAVLGSSLVTTMISGSQRSSLTIESDHILSQASFTLTVEAVKTGAFPVATPPAAWAYPPVLAPLIGTANAVGVIPSTSAAPKSDAWGSNLAYCTYIAAAQSDPVFAIISAGPDKIFQTNCTQAFAGLAQGDDSVRAKSVININKGVGGTVYYGDPVASVTALESLASAQVGEIRTSTDTGSMYINKTGTPGPGYWTLIGGGLAGTGAQPSPPAAPPLAVPGLPTVPSVPTIPLSAGSLWTWGANAAGETGNNTTTAKPTPFNLSTATTWGAAGGGSDNAFSIKSDGTLWAWGGNSSGELGNGTTTSSLVQAQIGTATNWGFVGSSMLCQCTIAIKTDGTLWRTGYNWSLGNVSSFTQLGSATNWGFASGNDSYGSIAAIATNGTLWAMGYNGYGKFGNGTTTSSTTLIQIGTATNWARVATTSTAVAAIKTDGTLWTAGTTSTGELGNGALSSTSYTLSQVGTGTTWASIAGGSNCFIAIKTDGTLWGWGAMYGIGKTAASAAPVQIDTATNWSQISAGVNWSAGIKADGTLWTWGSTPDALGTGSGYTVAPTQVGSATSWRIISALQQDAVGIQ